MGDKEPASVDAAITAFINSVLKPAVDDERVISVNLHGGRVPGTNLTVTAECKSEQIAQEICNSAVEVDNQSQMSHADYSSGDILHERVEGRKVIFQVGGSAKTKFHQAFSKAIDVWP